jgi:hypothetical protein
MTRFLNNWIMDKPILIKLDTGVFHGKMSPCFNFHIDRILTATLYMKTYIDICSNLEFFLTR